MLSYKQLKQQLWKECGSSQSLNLHLHSPGKCPNHSDKGRVFFKGFSTIMSSRMHPKDSIPDAQKTDMIYHWKCPAHNCTAEYIGETSRSHKERVSDHRIQTTSATRNHHISMKHPKAEKISE